MIALPAVIDDLDGKCAALDSAIREAAVASRFSYSATAPRFESIERIPDVIYSLIRHYTSRGFLCKYDGVNGSLIISWDHPNMSWLEHREITRATPSMLPNIGIGFRASMVYLCMTNNTDLRRHSDVTLQREIAAGIKHAAALGNTEMQFGFPEVPPQSVIELFRPTFDMLYDQGFQIVHDVAPNIFILKWGHTIDINMSSGAVAEVGDLV